MAVGWFYPPSFFRVFSYSVSRPVFPVVLSPSSPSIYALFDLGVPVFVAGNLKCHVLVEGGVGGDSDDRFGFSLGLYTPKRRFSTRVLLGFYGLLRAVLRLHR